jgi:hypothetical protein
VNIILRLGIFEVKRRILRQPQQGTSSELVPCCFSKLNQIIMHTLSKILAFAVLPLAFIFTYCQSPKPTQITTAKSGSVQSVVQSGLAPNGKKWNVLFIAVDDLNH